MKRENTKFIVTAAIAVLMAVAGGTAAWAQSCPTSPNYYPDFTSNQSCLTPNNNGADPGYPGFYPVVTPPPPPPVVSTVLRLTPNATFTAGSAWFNTPQPVSGAFSTTFMFELTGGNTDLSPADGIAFVIQNSALNALGPDGCGIGYGDDTSGCATTTGGIPNSLVVEFDTYQNLDDPNNNHVAIQSCGTSPNSSDNLPGGLPGPCNLAINANLPITLADGNYHTVTITYTGASTTLLDVILDGTDLFPGGITINLATLLSLNSGNAWVGFTAATGGGDDNQDILNWTFTPQAQTAVISQTQLTTLNFPNSSGNNVYDYNAQLTAPYPTPVVQVQPILMTQAACDAIVQQSFWPARCFVYENAENSGLDAAVMFAVTCPNSPGGSCGSSSNQNFFATLGTDFEFLASENPFFVYPGIFGLLNPFPGWLKGSGPNPQNPCTPPPSGPLFTSNQVATFYIDGGHTTGGSGGTGSCWVATYDTPGEFPPGITITTPTFTNYLQNQVVTASYTCYNPITSKPTTSPTGPYLTAASCTQSEFPPAPSNTNSCTSPPGPIQCTGPVDTSTLGLHTFFVTGIDSGGNTNVDAVVYNVVRKR